MTDEDLKNMDFKDYADLCIQTKGIIPVCIFSSDDFRNQDDFRNNYWQIMVYPDKNPEVYSSAETHVGNGPNTDIFPLYNLKGFVRIYRDSQKGVITVCHYDGTNIITTEFK